MRADNTNNTYFASKVDIVKKRKIKYAISYAWDGIGVSAEV